MNKKRFSKISEILQDAKRGKMFILVDDEGRENEGDLVIPASKATAKSIKENLTDNGLTLKPLSKMKKFN